MFVLIVGGGNTGSYLAKLLHEDGHKVRVIEFTPECSGENARRTPGGCHCSR